MKAINIKAKQKKYRIYTTGFKLSFDEQLLIHQKMDSLLKKVDRESTIELKLTKKSDYEAQVIIRGPVFGCNLKSSASNLNILINNLFATVSEEIHTWEESPNFYNEFASYLYYEVPGIFKISSCN